MFTWQRGKIWEWLDRVLWIYNGATCSLRRCWWTTKPWNLIIDLFVLTQRAVHNQRNHIAGRDVLKLGGWTKRLYMKLFRQHGRRLQPKARVLLSWQEWTKCTRTCIYGTRRFWRNLSTKFKKLKRELERLRSGQMTDESIVDQKEILIQLELLLEQEEIYWVQRARENWLKHGDRKH